MASDSGSIQSSSNLKIGFTPPPNFRQALKEMHQLKTMLGGHGHAEGMTRAQLLEKIKQTYDVSNYNPQSKQVEHVPHEQIHTISNSDNLVVHHKPSGMHMIASGAGPAAHDIVLAHARKTNPKAQLAVVDSSEMADLHKILLASPLGQGIQQPKEATDEVAQKVLKSSATQRPTTASAKQTKKMPDISRLSTDDLKHQLKNVHQKIQIIQKARNLAAARQRENEATAQTKRDAIAAKGLSKLELKHANLLAEINKRST